MIKQIQELAKQARYDSLYEKYYLQEIHKREISPTEYQDIYDKKFAELIIRECAQVCRNQTNEYAMKLDRENCASAIEEHFGVEA